MGTILVGTSGWDYPEWIGRVYPPKGPQDRLRYYADLFPTVEVNTTFYRLPPVGVVRSWLRRTPPGFRFAVKFPQSITHERRLVRSEAELARFVAVVDPIREAGRLLATLVQLPPSLAFDAGLVRGFYEALPAGLPVAVEFREPSWLVPESLALLREFRYAYTIVDEPHLPARLDVTAPFSYVRFHGHGHPVWYDYLYRPEELDPWVPRLRALAESTDAVYVFFNNHFRGDAVTNGRTLSEKLGLSPPAWRARLDSGPDGGTTTDSG